MKSRWTLNRAGILNVYQYGDETIDLAGGRLLLRGVNGSGKSTAMNMLLPFLIEADVRRIDAAGEQTGVLRSWILSGREEPNPVGYLWIEFERLDEQTGELLHLVCGCGIRASASTERVTTWWFVTDRRPGIDFSLLDRRTPLSVDALRSTIGSHAVFSHDRRVDYRTYRDANGWYFKARTSKDPLTGTWTQVTRRGFATATEASQARHRLLDLAAEAVQTASETGDASSHCKHASWKEVKARRRPRDE